MKKNIILFDFDGTITVHDTINVLASLATTRKNPHAAPLWKDIVVKYVADHARHLGLYRPEARERTTLSQELEFLESLGQVERASIDRVGGLGVFAAIRGDEFRAFGEEVVVTVTQKDDDEEETEKEKGTAIHEDEKRVDGVKDEEAEGLEDEQKVRIRRGFGELVDAAKQKGWELGVVSINWSREFIEGVLGRAEFSNRRIKANGISWPGGEVEGYEEHKRALMTVEDKARAMRDLVTEIRGGSDGGQAVGGKGGKVVYFGDSTTDMACLVEADLGVVMADDEDGSKLLKALRRVGLQVPHVKEFTGEEGLVWARDFEEVLRSKVVETLEG